MVPCAKSKLVSRTESDREINIKKVKCGSGVDGPHQILNNIFITLNLTNIGGKH